jgi:PHS family inorganic phosphate transporter-like MFS transporter
MSFNEKESSVSDVALDLNAKRRAALAEVDNAAFGWFHVKACAVAGVGFFTDAYDIFAINLAVGMVSNFPPHSVLSPSFPHISSLSRSFR